LECQEFVGVVEHLAVDAVVEYHLVSVSLKIPALVMDEINKWF